MGYPLFLETVHSTVEYKIRAPVKHSWGSDLMVKFAAAYSLGLYPWSLAFNILIHRPNALDLECSRLPRYYCTTFFEMLI
jgi:hypothetical protein